ncbi:hypothetical protein EVG20_g11549 [Dentipellis fragilis]|uniref:Uncharacterized protein n=1 Tax=Dentipellis fragilis TaxID=205917 RepID=A0A4Y9XK90_9AGAM|nr:hypothetical protein EVG20_g11549 [Dentipellis fragilis]
MPPCWCKFRGCNGKDIRRSTKKYHTDKDRRQVSESVVDEAHRNWTASPAPTPQNYSAEADISQANTSVELTTHERISTIRSPHAPEDIDHRDDAENRGRIYMEEVALRDAAVGHGIDDIGELAEEEEEEEEGEGRAPTGDGPSHNRVSTTSSSGVNPGVSVSGPLGLSHPLSSDPRYPDENTPDPFQLNISSQPSMAPITPLNTHTPMFLLYLLVSWLHTTSQLAFPACRAVLIVVGQILASAGLAFHQQHTPYKSLSSVMTNLGVEPVFQVLPVCATCLEVYPSNYASSSSCIHCSAPLFKNIKCLDRRKPSAKDIPRPLLQFPTRSIEAQLHDILAIPGMEDVLDAWRTKARDPGVLQDNFDGKVCHELQGPDGRIFFENPPALGCDELRIGLTLGVDW